MPDLPGLTGLTDDQHAAVVDAFSNAVNPATGEPVPWQAAYRRWLRRQLSEYVRGVRVERVRRQRAAAAAASADLFGTE